MPATKVLGDRDIARGRQTRNVLRGWRIHHPGAASRCEQSRHKGHLDRRNGMVKRSFNHIGYTSSLLASTSSARIGTPRLQAWTPWTTQSFSTSMTSSTVAPSFSAALMCRRVHVRERRIAGDAEELDLLGRHHAALINRDRSCKELVSPCRIELEERIPCGIPLADRPHRVASWCDRRWLLRRFRAARPGFLQKDRCAEAAGMDGH